MILIILADGFVCFWHLGNGEHVAKNNILDLKSKYKQVFDYRVTAKYGSHFPFNNENKPIVFLCFSISSLPIFMLVFLKMDLF